MPELTVVQLDGPDVVYVDKLESTGPLSLTSKIGGRNPAHATAVGKALLAWAYPTRASITEWVRRDGPLVRRTSRTIVDADHLARELARVRADGFSKDLEESEPGVRLGKVSGLVSSLPEEVHRNTALAAAAALLEAAGNPFGVRLDVDTVVEQETVTDTVRKEQIDTDGITGTGTNRR